MAVAETLRAVKQAIWVGWKIESNWTDPFLFFVYYMVRPLASLLIVGFIFLVGSFAVGSFDSRYFTFLFIGNAFFVYINHVVRSMSFLVHEDRARYEVLKHIYISPKSIHPYLLGRALEAAFDGFVSTILTIVLGLIIFGRFFSLQIPLDLLKINYLGFAFAMILGTFAVIFIGYVLSSINLVSSKLQFTLDEYVSGIFFLLGGVIFPPEILPKWVQPISYALPVTYFIRAIRSSLIFESSETLSNDLTYLLISAIAVAIFGILVFRRAERRAKRLGLIDRKAEY